MSKFKLLIATPVYNGASYLNRLAESINESASESNKIHWIIRNDGSTDDTSKVIKQLITDYPNICIHFYEGPNQGLTYGRNFLCDRFVCDFSEFSHMVFIDADDYFNPGWYTTIIYWLNKIDSLFNAESPYLCFKYYDSRRNQDECQIWTKLHTTYKAHHCRCQYPDGGIDLLHVIPRDYLIQVKKWDGNYYHVVKDEKWTPDTYNFMMYKEYPCSFIGDIVASLGTLDNPNMSDSYYNNIVTKFAKGQVDEIIEFLAKYGEHELGSDWTMVPGFRWRWYLKCLVRMIQNGTLVFSGKKWDNYESPLSDSKHSYNKSDGE